MHKIPLVDVLKSAFQAVFAVLGVFRSAEIVPSLVRRGFPACFGALVWLPMAVILTENTAASRATSSFARFYMPKIAFFAKKSVLLKLV